MKHIKLFEQFNRINEKNHMLVTGDFVLKLSNPKKVGGNIEADATMKFTDKDDIEYFLDNGMDSFNDSIKDWAESQGIITGDFSVGFDDNPKISGNTVTGKFIFWGA